MSSDDIAIRVRGLSKSFQIYEAPHERLKQFIFPRLQKLCGLEPKQYFQEYWALNDISFDVMKGETLGVIGRNGSGKSTLLQMICGTLHPSSGAVETNGRIAALLELGSGFNPEFSGRENVYMNAAVLGLSQEEVDARYEDIINFAEIGQFIEQPVKTYSSGMVVRLAFAVIAHVDADILVIDEALAVGDAFFTQKCMRFLRTFMQSGTVLFVSHDTGAILNLCQRVVWLENGVVESQGVPKDVTEDYLERLYTLQQGDSDSLSDTKVVSNHHKLQEAPLRDMRHDFINNTALRNDIELFPFSEDSQSFGKGGARIQNIQILDESEQVLSWVVGGEPVKLVISCFALERLARPIVGFQIKDRLGQVVFSDNTYLTYLESHVIVSAQTIFEACFEFNMPIMPIGDYTVTGAIAEGTVEEHVQHFWTHSALAFKVHSSKVCYGLVGIPMHNISLLSKE